METLLFLPTTGEPPPIIKQSSKTKKPWLLPTRIAVLIMTVACFATVQSHLQHIREQRRYNLTRNEPDEEADWQRLQRERTETTGALWLSCSNEIVGFHGIIRKYINDSDPDPNKWSSDADVEFVDRFGETGLTNLQFTFYTWGDMDGLQKVSCIQR
jgi:hypothetical protein